MLGSASVFLPLGSLSAVVRAQHDIHGSFQHLQWPISEPKHGPMEVLCQSVPYIGAFFGFILMPGRDVGHLQVYVVFLMVLELPSGKLT